MPVLTRPRVVLGVTWLLVAFALSGLTRAEPQAQLLAGAAKGTITPFPPVYLAGFEANRLSTGVHDDLFARALVLQAGEQSLAMVSLDLIGLLNKDVQQIRAQVSSLPPEDILIAATHTHSGPDTIGFWGPDQPDEAYMERLVASVAEVIGSAQANLRPARLRFAVTQAEGISRNSRVPEILDTTVSILHAETLAGKPIATLVNFACHPEVLHTDQVTADFPGYLYRRLEERVGEVAIFLNGAQGGMVTPARDQPFPDNWARAQHMGYLLADRAIEVISTAPVCEDPTILHEWKSVSILLENPAFRALAAAKGWSALLKDGQIVTEVHHFTIGDAEFVTIPGEALPNIGFALKRHMRGDPKFILGLCNDELGYLLSEEDWGLLLYAYETSVCVGPLAGRRVYDSLKDLIRGFLSSPTQELTR